MRHTNPPLIRRPLAPVTLRHICALGAVVLTAGCAHGPPRAAAATPPPGGWRTSLRVDHPLVGRVYSVQEKRFVTPAELLDAVARARFVLLGEKHDNSDAHALQAWALAGLMARGQHPAVVFEMVPRDQQPALDGAVAQPAPTAATLSEALVWSKSGWPDFNMYAPIFLEALRGGLALVAGDLAKDDLTALRGGDLSGLTAEDRKRYGLDMTTPDRVRTAMINELRDGHCGFGDETRFGKMVVVQWARDAQLARALVEAEAKAGSAVLIAGNGHSRNDRAVPLHLAHLAPGAGVRAVAFIEVDVTALVPEAYIEAGDAALPYDYVYFTPRVDEDDPCAGLKERMQKAPPTPTAPAAPATTVAPTAPAAPAASLESPKT